MCWVLCHALGIHGLLTQSPCNYAAESLVEEKEFSQVSNSVYELRVDAVNCDWKHRKSSNLKDDEMVSLVLGLVRISSLKTIKVEMNERSDLEKRIELMLCI